jgi:hypothetical protein
LRIHLICRLTLTAGLMIGAGRAQALTFISPMGEPFRSGPGDKPPEELWFEQADRNGDGKITRAEFLADAGRFFQLLDVNHDREIGPEEIERYEEEVAPEVRTGGFDLPPQGAGGGHRGGHGAGGGSRRRGGVGHVGERGAGEDEGVSSDSPSFPEHYDPSNEGASRYSYLDLPEPVAAADTDFNRGVSPREFAAAANERFDALDTNHDGVLTRDELPKLGGARSQRPRGGTHGHRMQEGLARPEGGTAD